MTFLELLQSWWPFFGTLAGAATILLLAHWFLRRRAGLGNFLGQLALIAMTAVAVVTLIAFLPVDAEMRGQLFSLVGVVASGVLALSSTTFVGNALAGLMLRALQNFRPGDFVRVGDHFGRISDRGLFRTELQTEDRDLTTLPNLYLVTKPVTVVRSSGTIVSAQVSLGYDTPRALVEKTLLEAAQAAGLEEGFVQVLELGDFSVLYRVAGLLKEVTTLLSSRSRLRCAMLDALHGVGIEIVSPNFMNTRSADKQVLPSRSAAPEAAPTKESGRAAESVVFDKAEEAAQVEEAKDRLGELAQEREETQKLAKQAGPEEQAALKKRAEELRQREERVKEALEERLKKDDKPAGPRL